MRATEKTHYTVCFDGNATHRCETLEEARAFAESPTDELGIFDGQKPVRIVKVTTTTITDNQTVYEYGEDGHGEPVEHEDARDGGDFPRAFYTVPQAAEELQVHENTVYRLVRGRKVEHFMVGKQIRIAAAELARLKVERGEQ